MNQVSITVVGEAAEEGWVVCRIFKKKNLHKSLSSPIMSTSISSSITEEITRSSSQMFDDDHEGAFEEMLQYIGSRTCKEENNEHYHLHPINTGNCDNINDYHDHGDRFLKLPSLESPNSTSSQNGYQPIISHEDMVIDQNEGTIANQHLGYQHVDDSASLTNWAALDRLVASQLNGGHETGSSRQFAFLIEPIRDVYCTSTTDNELQLPSTLRSSTSSNSSSKSYHSTQPEYNNSEIDLWTTFAAARLQSSSPLSSSDALCHVSNAPI